MGAKLKNNLVFKETCGLWKHNTSMRTRILCSAMLAEKPLKKEKSGKLFVKFVAYNFVCVVESVSACEEGDFGPIWLTLTHRVVCVCALRSHNLMTYFHVNPDCPIIISVIGQVSHLHGRKVSAGNVPVFTISVLAPTM